MYTESLDFEIMKARTKAKARGATPAEIERNIVAVEVSCALRKRNQFIRDHFEIVHITE